MKSIAFAALTSTAAAFSANELEFSNYAARFNKVYEDMAEYAARFETFVHWDRIISEHNSPNETNSFFHKNFKLGHNQFSDWTDAEYEAILGFIAPGSGTDENEISRV